MITTCVKYLPAFLILTVLAQHAALGQDEGHRDDSRALSEKWWLSGQVNVVGQMYPSFPAAYSGPLSLSPEAQAKPTWVATIYTGYAPFQNTELFLDIESAKGAGVSGALGLGGLGDLDAVTLPKASAMPYIARALVRQIIALSQKRVEADRNPLGLSATVPERRLELRLGKMSLADFFDLNAVGSDSHLQFLNYSIDNNATYDIAADARGYTYAALAELYLRNGAIRFAEALEPHDPSGGRTEWNLARSNSENLEFEAHPFVRGKQPFTIRALGFFNHAEMGSYPQALARYELNPSEPPDLSGTIRNRTNWGAGLNGESELRGGVRVFGRWGRNQGSRESYQFAEADRTVSVGSDLDGRFWHRKSHRAGLAFASNGLTAVHRQYLALGGVSYLLGDGALRYGRETLVEAYYNVPFGHGLFGAFDVQRIWNPGYNQDRGPVIIFGLRFHAERDVHFN